MKYCVKCGEQLLDNSVQCPRCGQYCLDAQNGQVQNTSNQKVVDDQNVSKTGIGVICSLFLGVIGLIIGLLLYQPNTLARKTFIKGWVWSSVLTIVIVFFGYMLIIAAVM